MTNFRRTLPNFFKKVQFANFFEENGRIAQLGCRVAWFFPCFKVVAKLLASQHFSQHFFKRLNYNRKGIQIHFALSLMKLHITSKASNRRRSDRPEEKRLIMAGEDAVDENGIPEPKLNVSGLIGLIVFYLIIFTAGILSHK